MNPRLKTILGGCLLIGIFVSIFSLSGEEKISANLLRSEATGTIPLIQSISPTSGEIGSSVYITGKNFSDVTTQNLVKFGDQTAVVKTVGYAGEDTMRIIAIVPNLLTGQSYEVTVRNQGGTAIGDAKFEVTAGEVKIPSITRFEPTNGYAGDKVYLFGDNFSAEAVGNVIELETENGNGVRASKAEIVHVENSTALKFTIPEGAITGKIYLTVGGVKTESTTNLEILTEAPVVENPPAATPEIPTANPTEVTPGSITPATTEAPIATPENPAVTPIDLGNIPQNLQLTSDAAGYRLTWEKPVTEASYTYKIYYSTRSGSYLHRFEVGSVTTTPVGNNLSLNQRYFFAATAMDEAGNESNPSNEVSFVFDGSKTLAVAAFAQPTISEELHPAAEFISAIEAPAPRLSEEGPAETLLIASFIATLASGWFFRKKIFAK